MKTFKQFKEEGCGDDCECMKESIDEAAIDAKGFRSSTGGLTHVDL